MATNIKASTAPYSMMITFEIEPADEAEFNDIYDNDHIPTIMKLPGVKEVLRFRDAEPNERGYLVYSAIYLMTEPNLHETPAWKKVSDTGRWMPVIRPKVKSRARRKGPVVAHFKQ